MGLWTAARAASGTRLTIMDAGAGATGSMPDGVAVVAAVLSSLGAANQPRALPGPARTAAQAAAHLGVPSAAIANSLVFTAELAPVLVMTSGGHRANPLALAALLGVAKVRPATAGEVRRWTGQPIGGVAPVGHPSPLPTLVDVELSRFDSVWCGAGHPHWVFETTYAELLRVTAGEATEVGDLAVEPDA